MRRIVVTVVAAGALGVMSAAPASAGQANVAPGSVYKGTYTHAGIHDYKFRIKTFESGRGGAFTLRCAGVVREKIEIRRGEFKLEFGADEVLVKGKGKFKKDGVVEGEISKIDTNGAECLAPGEFAGVIADV